MNDDRDDYLDDYDDFGVGCDQCDGEGFVAHCWTEYACMYPDEGCDLCLRRCDFCNRPKPTPETEALRAVLGEALAKPPPASLSYLREEG